ncbi:MAG: helix-turn-helix domain-containing protein [Flavobacteriales bacterium]|nr:helix-turn-helix domain-containing protein [Flavobacteriales bacterium]
MARTIQPDKSIAVLPFVNMSGSMDNEYFSDGMTEEIINGLAKIKGLKVTSRTSAFSFKNKNVPIQQIGRQLNVSTILEGSVRLSGNIVRITAQLIDAVEDFHFWSETFDRELKDVFAVQDEVSLLIADKLREHVGHFDIDENLIDRFDIPVETYKKYLKGRYYLMKLNLPDTEKAISILEEVISDEPDFPRAYLDINQGYAFLGTMGLIPAQDAFVKARPFLGKAIELGENLPQTQLNLAWISCWQNWDLEMAYQHLNRALEVQPSDEIYLTIANILSVQGKFDAAFHFIDKALEIAPLSSVNQHFKGFLYYLQEQYEKSIPFFERSLELQPELPFPHLYFGSALLLMGRKAEGLAYFEGLQEKGTDDLTKLGGITITHALMANETEATKGMAKLEGFLETSAAGSALNFLILCQTLIGNTDRAIELVERGISNRQPMMLLLNTEPLVKSLRSIPRFQELMQQAIGIETSFDPSIRKYKKALLNKTDLSNYSNQLETLMLEECPYLNPDLTLRSLALLLEIPPNYLSQLLNEGLDKNFAEYINTYRLEAFMGKVVDPKQQHLTILALAYDSGFNSKTVFNTFFKKKTGKTPKVYWKEVVG